MKIYNLKSTEPLSFFEFIGIVLLAILLAPVTIILLPWIIKLKKYCKAKDYTVTKLPEEYKEKVTLIAHRGFRALAPENTLPAFEEAGKASFWGAECDIHRSKDGVWVLCHDSFTYRVMNKNCTIEKSNYTDLQKLYVNNGSNFRNYPNLRMTTLDEYLNECAKYNMKAVIELKGKLNTEYYNEIIEMVEKHGVDAIYISFEKIAVQTMRKLSDAKLFFIVYDVSKEDVEFAKSIPNCGIDFDGNDKRNQSKEKMDMIINAGLTPCLWAVDDVELVKQYADWGVRYITTNQICY